MAYTEYVDWTTGLTLYGKAKPLDLTWATGIITLAENGTTGEYSASTFVDDTQYSIYVQLAGSPASGDTKIATVTPDSAILDKFVFTVAGQVDANALTSLAGAGSESWELTVQTGGVPVAGVECWVSTDIAGANVVAGTLVTDDFGVVTFLLDVGTYYLWRDVTTDTFPNPTAFTVS